MRHDATMYHRLGVDVRPQNDSSSSSTPEQVTLMTSNVLHENKFIPSIHDRDHALLTLYNDHGYARNSDILEALHLDVQKNPPHIALCHDRALNQNDPQPAVNLGELPLGQKNNIVELENVIIDCSTHSCGEMTVVCSQGDAFMWNSEKLARSRITRFGLCCLLGLINIPHIPDPPMALQNIFTNNASSRYFLKIYVISILLYQSPL